VSGVDWWELPGAAPLYATRRDLSRRTEGPRIGLLAEALGTPYMPWQQYTADVGTELLPDGRYAYPIVVLSVPRQAGKTTELRTIGTDRGLANPNTGVFYTAQTGKDARERWRDLVTAITSSPLAPLATVRSAAGSERVVWPNGSMFRCFSPVATSLHGYTPPLVMLDEAFAHDQQTGDDLMGAIGPAQITIPNRQLWIVSTKGTARSAFLNQWLETARAGTPGVAIFEWAAGPDVDVYDPQTWPDFHPALGFTITPEDIAAEARRLPRAEFERAYGNRSTRTASHHIAAESWDRLAAPGMSPPELDPAGVVFTFDTMHDRSRSALVATWREGGTLLGRVAKAAPGMAWLVEAVAELHAQGWRTFACAEDGPGREAADAIDRLELPGLQLERVGGRDYADSWGFLLQHIAEGTMRHDGSDALAIAASNVATRPMMDTAAPSRRASAGDVTPIIGLMVGAYVLDHKAAPLPAMAYRFGT
jgi:hypothetical protein